jgi:hypothetical protein
MAILLKTLISPLINLLYEKPCLKMTPLILIEVIHD